MTFSIVARVGDAYGVAVASKFPAVGAMVPAARVGVGAVATNRLHVHVFCAMHGIPHFVADNSYGKIRQIFQDYSGAFSTARWCGSLSEAMAEAERYGTS